MRELSRFGEPHKHLAELTHRIGSTCSSSELRHGDVARVRPVVVSLRWYYLFAEERLRLTTGKHTKGHLLREERR